MARLPLDDPDPDVHAIAAELLAKLQAEGLVEEVLLLLLEQAVRQEHRRRTRNLEHEAAETLREAARQATTQPSSSAPRQADPWLTIDQSKAHLERLLKLGSWRQHQRVIAWSQATIEDHQARISSLDRNIGGLERTKANHREAISVLRATGRRCLGEVAA